MLQTHAASTQLLWRPIMPSPHLLSFHLRYCLFEVLCSFDKEYAGFVAQNSPTGEFINVVIARTDKRTRAFEGTLVRAR